MVSILLLRIFEEDTKVKVSERYVSFITQLGSFAYWETASEDGYDTMEWIANQTWSNQKVLYAGIPYLLPRRYSQVVIQPSVSLSIFNLC
jgi:hypothetical protein